MRVAFGSTVLRRALQGRSLDGIGRYSGELSGALEQLDGVSLCPFVFSGKGLRPADIKHATDAGSFLRQALFSLATGRQFPVAAKNLTAKADLVHATDHFIPKLRGIPVVATLHDAIPLSHPEWINYSFKALKNALWKRSAHWADHVITVSENSKREVGRWFGIPPERISVTPLGVGRQWFSEISREELGRVKRQHALPERFFLFVGTVQPRKNVGRLIAAHRTLPVKIRREIPLLVAGRAGWQCEAEIAALEGGDNGALRHLGHVPEDDLVPLVKQASVVMLPSLHEGFGLPVLEAFAAGTPVIASKAGAIPEVAGDAAILVAPLDVSVLAQAMRRAAEDTALADALRTKGRERATRFTWQRTAELTAEVYRQVLERGKTG